MSSIAHPPAAACRERHPLAHAWRRTTPSHPPTSSAACAFGDLVAVIGRAAAGQIGDRCRHRVPPDLSRRCLHLPAVPATKTSEIQHSRSSTRPSNSASTVVPATYAAARRLSASGVALVHGPRRSRTTAMAANGGWCPRFGFQHANLSRGDVRSSARPKRRQGRRRPVVPPRTASNRSGVRYLHPRRAAGRRAGAVAHSGDRRPGVVGGHMHSRAAHSGISRANTPNRPPLW